MKVLIDLPDPPPGFEYTGEFRPALRDEFYLGIERDGKAGLRQASGDHRIDSLQLIFRSRWEPPKGVFKPGWIARDGEGAWYWWELEPDWNSTDEDWIRNPEVEKMRELPSEFFFLGMCAFPDIRPEDSLRRVE